MRSRGLACAASSLLTGLFDDSARAPVRLTEVARTRASVHLATGRDDVPVLCLCTPEAVRLPATVVVGALPSGRLTVRSGLVDDGTAAWRVTRWWQPPRPHGLVPPRFAPTPTAVLGDVRPLQLIGLGPGLTPAGDDVVAGALVAAHATSDPRLTRWQEETRVALRARRTTAVSHGLLHHAVDGYATPELAAFVTGVCAGDAGQAAGDLLAVGHTSGPALAIGALHVLTTGPATVGRAA